jgi:hypothetical protein
VTRDNINDVQLVESGHNIAITVYADDTIISVRSGSSSYKDKRWHRLFRTVVTEMANKEKHKQWTITIFQNDCTTIAAVHIK